jgi:hypothetical protein
VNEPSSRVVRPLRVHSREIEQTHEERHPKLNRRDDIVTHRQSASLNTVTSDHRHFTRNARAGSFIVSVQLFSWQ